MTFGSWQIVGSEIRSAVAKSWELGEGFDFIGHKGTFCNDGMFYSSITVLHIFIKNSLKCTLEKDEFYCM